MPSRKGGTTQMNRRTRRIAAFAAAAMAALSALAAANHAQARFPATSLDTPDSTLTRIADGTAQGNSDDECKIKPRWVRKWNNELNRFTWKKIWVERCEAASN